MLLADNRNYLEYMRGCIRIANLTLLCSTLFKVGNPIMPTNVRDSQATQTQGHSVTTIASFGGIKYYVDPEPAQVVLYQPARPSDGFFSSLNGDLRPCTVIICSANNHTRESLTNITSVFSNLDDVWTPAFYEGETSRRHTLAIEFNCLQEDAS